MNCPETNNPPTQYASDRNLRARLRLWEAQEPRFDLYGWVLGLADIGAGDAVIDVGCGNGAYLPQVTALGGLPVGVDLSAGMLRAVTHRPVVAASAEHLPFRGATFDIALAPHMLYHVDDRPRAIDELRRVLRPDGVLVAVTNGAQHMAALRDLVETAARRADRDWVMSRMSTEAFSLENGSDQLATAFDEIRLVLPPNPVTVRIVDPEVVADYVASVADFYESGISQPWTEIVTEVRDRVAAIVAERGFFEVTGVTGAFVCRS